MTTLTNFGGSSNPVFRVAIIHTNNVRTQLARISYLMSRYSRTLVFVSVLTDIWLVLVAPNDRNFIDFFTLFTLQVLEVHPLAKLDFASEQGPLPDFRVI